MRFEPLKISVDDDFKYLQLEPFLRAEVEDLLQASPKGSKVSLALERQSTGAEARIHFSHPTHQFNVKGEGENPLDAVENALNRFEGILAAWVSDRGYSHSSVVISAWPNDSETNEMIASLLEQSDLHCSYQLEIKDPELLTKLSATDVLLIDWPTGAEFLRDLEERFLSGFELGGQSNFAKPVILLLSDAQENFQFHRSRWFFPIGTIGKSAQISDENLRLRKYLDFVLRNKSKH